MRTFLFFSLLAVGILSTVGGVWLGRSMQAAAGSVSESAFVQDTAETVVHALEGGGTSALENLEAGISPQGKLRIFVFDNGLHEVTGRTEAETVRAFAGKVRDRHGPQFDVVSGKLIAGTVVVAQDGRPLSVVIRFPKNSVGDLPIKKVWAWTGRLAVIAATALVLCFWIAGQLTTPLSRLRRAARRFASGDLKARADAATFSPALPEYHELARDFDDMAGRIEVLVESQRQLLRDVSHELRTPLTRLSLAIDLARHLSGPAIAGPLRRIEQESERLNALIDRILRLSRLESSVEPPQRDCIELADFVESIASDADFEATAAERRVSIVRAETCRVVGDRELLREAIENVIRNAIRYTPRGTAVTVEAYCDGPSTYSIVIRDGGPGVSVEYLEAIFEPFNRGPQRTDTDPRGFGIGLAIAKQAVDLHQGTIAAQNLVGGGFELAIRLPVSSPDQKTA